MNWFNENKALSAVLGVILLAAAGLGYLLFTAKSAHDAALEDYNAKLQALSGLRALKPYRNAENLAKLQAQREDYSKTISDLQAGLIKKQGEIKPVDPASFQNRLRSSVSATIAKAKEKRVALPEKFFLGFDKYDSSLPPNDITGVLDWQLSAIESIIGSIIDLKVGSLDLVRVPVPGEEGGAAASTPVPAPGAAPKNAPVAAQPLLIRYPFEITVNGYQNNIQTLLNQLLTANQFLIVRAVRVENEQLKGPPKGGADAGSTPPPASSEQSGANTAAQAIAAKIVVGTEQVQVKILLDLIYFVPPPEAEASPTPAK